MTTIIKGKGCQIDASIQILGEGDILLGDNVRIGEHVTINVSEILTIGPRSVIGDYATIEGRDIGLGTEFWSDRYVTIGGGSCMEEKSRLKIGYWGHLGQSVFINTARSIEIGNEVGLGTATKLYTHGAYLSFLDGFPVDYGPITIGNRVWIPGATVLPGVTIGSDTVVGVGSVVTKSLPPGCLAMGIPARVIKENAYPQKLTDKRVQIMVFLMNFNNHIAKIEAEYLETIDAIVVTQQEGETVFNLKEQKIEGNANRLSERLRNELRRYGVRFKSYVEEDQYRSWNSKQRGIVKKEMI